MKRTDLILALGMLAAVFLAGVSLTVMGTLDGLLSWAWERHHNILSWYVRPLFLLPLAYFSYRHSLLGIVLTLVALATSMFWFPAPERVDPMVREFLRFEKEWLIGEWTIEKAVSALAVPLILGVLCLAFWRRSLLWGLIIICHRLDEAGVGYRRRRGYGLGHARARLDGPRDLRRDGALCRAKDRQGSIERTPACCTPSGSLSLPTLSRGLLPVAIEEPAEARLTPL